MNSSPRKIIAAKTAGRQTLGQLRSLQRLAATAIMRPLGPTGKMRSRWIDGQKTKTVVSQFIKPNDRLSSFDRLEIYNRQYWYRLIDCFYDDYPGLRAVLGGRKFDQLAWAYIARYPSRSFSLRNLGSRLEQFLQDEPRWTTPHRQMALEMARFEWVQIESFDCAALPTLTVDDLLGRDPGKLRVKLQPHLRLLKLSYPLDDYILAIRKKFDGSRREASNAVEDTRTHRPRLPARPRPRRIFLAVHRFNDSLYYKRLEPEAFTILSRLGEGATIARACAAAFKRARCNGSDPAEVVKDWFGTWTELGWFCKPGSGSHRKKGV